MRVPRGPLAETFFCQEPPLSFPPIGSSSSIYSRLESISGVLVLQFPILPMEIHLGYFEPYRKEITEMHSEVRYCLWAMNVSLSVYMELLCLVDIDVRQDISDTVGNFLAGWKGGRTHALTDSLDELIISQFNLHSITRVPDMVRLQKEKHCNSISSTVAAYIRDLAINIDNMSQGDLDGAIQFLFPFSEKFIGRCFFPRLAMVASRLLDIIKLDSCKDPNSIDSNSSEESAFSGTSLLSDIRDLTSLP